MNNIFLDESCSANESRDNRKMRAHSKTSRQAELKRFVLMYIFKHVVIILLHF